MYKTSNFLSNHSACLPDNLYKSRVNISSIAHSYYDNGEASMYPKSSLSTSFQVNQESQAHTTYTFNLSGSHNILINRASFCSDKNPYAFLATELEFKTALGISEPGMALL